MEYAKRFLFILFLASICCILRGGANNGMQQNEESNALPLIIKENTIIFYSVSPEDYENLGYPDREGGEGLSELIGDYLYQTLKLKPQLEQLGIRVILSTSKEMSFQMITGKTKKLTFNPRDIYAMALYAKGQEPKIAIGFIIGKEMRNIISEYFHIKVE